MYFDENDSDDVYYDSDGDLCRRNGSAYREQMASADSWGSGTIIKLVSEKNFGFIQTRIDLPSGFTNKNVFLGGIPPGCDLNVGDEIMFQLYPQHKEKPSAQIVRKDGVTIIDKRPRSRGSSQPRNRERGGRGNQHNTRQRSHSRDRSARVPRVLQSIPVQRTTVVTHNRAQPSPVPIQPLMRYASQTNSNSTAYENLDPEMVVDIPEDTRSSLSVILSKSSMSRAKQKRRKKNETPNVKERQHGHIVNLKDNFGFIRPIGLLPQGYENKDVHFLQSKVKSGGLKLRNWDEVEFTLGIKDKTKPMAFNVKLAKFRERSAEDLKDYLEDLAEKLASPMSKSERKNPEYVDTILSVLTCEAVWEAIGSCRELSNTSTFKVIEILQLLEKHGNIFVENFRKIMQTLCETAFLNIRSGKFRRIVELVVKSERQDLLEELQDFLIQVVKYVPGKLTAVTALAKLMLPDDCSNVAHFFFKILKETAKFSSDYMEDMEWNELPLVPSVPELQSELQGQRLDLRPVKPEGSYQSADAYVDTYFRLLRADCFNKLCEGVQALLNGNLDPRDMYVYHTVQFAGIQITNNETGLNVALKLTPLKAVRNWASAPNLMFGNLLCVSVSGTFSDPIWASVANRDENLLQKENIIVIELASEVNSLSDADVVSLLMKNSDTTVIAESPTYYRAYKPTLKALQSMDLEQMPFQEELVEGKRAASYRPEFLNDSEIDVTSIATSYDERTVPVNTFIQDLILDRMETTLDTSQRNAIAKALCNRVAIIQGPPGTGKTFLGIRLVQLLLSLSNAPSGPILILTYKNHALDEFLKEAQELFPGEVARIGGRSKELELKDCNLNQLRFAHKREGLYDQLRAIREEMDDFKPLLQEAVRQVAADTIVSINTLIQNASNDQLESLLLQCPWHKLKATYKLPDSKGRDPITLALVEIMLKSLQDRNVPLANVLENDKETPLWQMLTTAFQRWLPSKVFFDQVKDEVAKKNYRGLRTSLLLKEKAETLKKEQEEKMKKKKQNSSEKEEDEDDNLFDEHDIEDEQTERLAAVSSDSQPIELKDLQLLQKKKGNEKHLFCTIDDLNTGIPVAIFQSCSDLWQLSENDRVKLLQMFLLCDAEDASEDLHELLQKYQLLCKTKNELENQHSVDVLSGKKIIAMTMTGANMHQRLVEQLEPPIVIVEEAAEVLEPQLTAVLGPWVKQLILIGDHMQLRPSVETYQLTKEFHFDISMMERLINNKLPFTTLAMQNRMRPEIAKLLHDIYPNLKDNRAVVAKNQKPNCVLHSVFFWDHIDPESGGKDSKGAGRSYSNTPEADRVIRLALFFLQQGYRPNQVTILSAYQGQVKLLRTKIRKAEQGMKDLFPGDLKEKTNRIQIHTIDMFQGDENDIVIVSLVRSSKPGFLGTFNRRCVSQSRSRCGLYFVGNSVCLKQSETWRKLISNIDEMNIGPAIPLVCPRHPESIMGAVTADDLKLDSFCRRPCHEIMPCKSHMCKKTCQPPHHHAKCEEEVLIELKTCGHILKKKCFADEKTIPCKEKCRMSMHCNLHPCKAVCSTSHSHKICMEKVAVTHAKCGQVVTKPCYEPVSTLDGTCDELVTFVYTSCNHPGERRCRQSEWDVLCKSKCGKELVCGHLCTLECSTDCQSALCKICEEEKARKAAMLRKEQEDLMMKQRKELQRKLDELQSRIDHSRDEISTLDPDYNKIKDMVKKTVVPEHEWHPWVEKIERVFDKELEKKWLETRNEMFDPRRTELKFHGTDSATVETIVDDGFRMRSSSGNFGRGIYFATGSSKSGQDRYTKQSDMLLVCEVALGKIHTVHTRNSNLNGRLLKLMGNDSIYAPRSTRESKEVYSDEYVVFNPDQAIVRFIVYYTNLPLLGPIEEKDLEEGTKELKRYEIEPQRELSVYNPLDEHFRLVESQFQRLIATKHKTWDLQDLKIEKVEYYFNPELFVKFNLKAVELRRKYGKSPEIILGFHGTREGSIESIVKNNFDLAKIASNTGNQGKFGKGIYFSEFPDVGIGYSTAENAGAGGVQYKKLSHTRTIGGLLLCKTLPGRSFLCEKLMTGTSLKPGYDSHCFNVDKEGRTHETVIFDTDQILPCYVLHLARK